METTQELDFSFAEGWLHTLMQEYLHQGSLGISHFMIHLKPLWTRVQSGERSQELYELIMKEN